MRFNAQIAILVTASLAIGGLAGAGVTWHRMVEQRRLSLVIRFTTSAMAANDSLEQLDQANNEALKGRLEASLAANAIALESFSHQQGLPGDIARQALGRLTQKRARPSIKLAEAGIRKSIELANAGQNHK
jgi:hypothetical protein